MPDADAAQHWHGRIGTVVCGIPLVLLPLAEQRRFIDAIEAVAPGRGFLHYSYCATSPLPWRKHELSAQARGLDAAELPARQRLALHAHPLERIQADRKGSARSSSLF